MSKKKLSKLLALYLPYVAIGLLATNLGEAWRLAVGKELGDKIVSLMDTLPAAFSNPLPSLHPFDLFIGLCCGAGMRLAVYLKGKNAKKYRHGMEYGSARWGTPKDIEPFMAPKFADNIILTKTERLMMSNRPPDPKNARNKNVLVVGGSGSGKTRFFIKPNCRNGGYHSIPGGEVHPCGAPAAAPVLHTPEMDKRPMKTINLKKYYYPICKKDTFVEVPDEVADAIVEESRAENANDAKQHYHCYSLDASPGIENHFPEQVISPEDILMEKETEREQEAAHALMMERLREALATLTPRQASCLHARFLEGKQFKEIAEDEGFTTSAAIVTVRNAIIKLQKYYIKRGWMKPPKEKTICTKTAPPKRNRKKTSAKKS